MLSLGGWSLRKYIKWNLDKIKYAISEADPSKVGDAQLVEDLKQLSAFDETDAPPPLKSDAFVDSVQANRFMYCMIGLSIFVTGLQTDAQTQSIINDGVPLELQKK